MENTMQLEVRFEDNRMRVVAELTFQPPYSGELSFLLAQSLHVTAVTSGGRPLPFSSRQAGTPLYRCPAQAIVLEDCRELSQLTVSYGGTVEAWQNIIREDLRAVNFYSGWYPYGSPALPQDGSVDVHAEEGEVLLKGRFDPTRKVWTYQSGYDPFNLLLLNRRVWRETAGEGCCVHWSHAQEEQTAGELLHLYNDIWSYYTGELYASLARPETDGTFDIVSLGLNVGYGAYFRRQLIVMSDFPQDVEELASLLGHELGHTWGSGADTTSWEDWLNETVAEWSCLCYLRERRGETAYREQLQKSCGICGQFPSIRTLDGSRPDGVHEMGTALFAWIEQKAGMETVKNLLRVFAGLKEKTTENYLAAVDAQLGADTAGWIRNALDGKDFLKELNFIEK